MKRKGLTRSIPDRILIGLLGLLFAPLMGVALFARIVEGDTVSHGDWVLKIWFSLLMEGVLAVFIISVLGVIWAIGTPDWIERLLHKAAHHFLIVLLFMAVFLGGLAVAVSFMKP